MKLNVFHLNIQAGRKLDDVISYLKTHNFDIIHVQEISAGKISKSGSDNFLAIKNALNYSGELAITTRRINDASTYHGIATFFKPELQLVERKEIWLKPFFEFDEWVDGGDFARQLPKVVLALKFNLGDKQLWSINTHLAWGPTPKDEPYKIDQAKPLISFVSSLAEPFILSGDFNLTSDSQVVKELSQYGINHTVRNELTNTLNPNLHRAHDLFPKGLAVDYIYTGFMLGTENFELVDVPDLSDHYGLRITIDLED